VTNQESTFADDVLNAGTEAYQQYIDQQKEKEALTPEVTTQRMLRLAQDTTDIADRTIDQLERQKEELSRQQRDVAEMHDDLNTSEKKMRAIKSGWGGLVNVGSSKKHNQHQKALNKWDLEREKSNIKDQKIGQKESYEQSKIDVHNNEKLISGTTHDFHRDQHQAKKDSRLEAKNITKGRAEQREATVNFGGLIFEEHIEGTGPKCQAEKDLEALYGLTQGLKQKSFAQAVLTEETTDQINYINDGINSGVARTQALNSNMVKYVKHG